MTGQKIINFTLVVSDEAKQNIKLIETDLYEVDTTYCRQNKTENYDFITRHGSVLNGFSMEPSILSLIDVYKRSLVLLC